MSPADAPDEAAPKRPTDPLKAYVVVFALLSLLIGYLYFNMASEQSAYEQANAEAPRLLGNAAVPATSDQRPTTLYALGVDVLKFLETYKASQIKPGETGRITTTVQDRLSAMGLGWKATGSEGTQRVPQKHYEETSIRYDLEPASIETFAKALYNIEGKTTTLRVLDLSWQLRDTKANPYPPGDAIQNESFRVGFRKPLVER